MRIFHERIGVTPKLYSRLARFRTGLTLLSQTKVSRANLPGVQAALELGYSDQPHMIADFREFTGRTPVLLSGRSHFHPFNTAP